uniref:NADH-ubiquinone oxidoreductase chain 4 n=1 Tax=Flaccisagitta enflata TaxID=366393 RepID=D3DKN7_9BILA|nr:NADH dehydrogenase subunit 4 [Flaccisagitta enflata]BAI68186.1 NADH dehydrogenase subunit 4 [Flaccisagitta enflata]
MKKSLMEVSLIVMSFWLFQHVVVMEKMKSGGMYSTMCIALLVVVVSFFLTNKTLSFYILFELSLIPTLMMIFFFGYQPEKMQASMYLLVYTVLASLPLLLIFCSNSKYLLFMSHMSHSWYVMALTLGFMVKTPLYLVHVWLPKAHVEAPVGGSMVLAGVLLKLGSYGLMLMCPTVKNELLMVYVYLSLLGAIFCSYMCLLSYDMKSLIAYSSVVHMGVVTMGVVSGFEMGYKSALMMVIAHGVCSPFLFGWGYSLYLSSHSRVITVNKGQMSDPKMVFIGFMLLAINMGVPPFLNLWSEIIMFIVTSEMWKMSLGWLMVAAFMNMLYNMFLYVSVGQSKESNGKSMVSNMWPFLSSMSSSLVLVLVL